MTARKANQRRNAKIRETERKVEDLLHEGYMGDGEVIQLAFRIEDGCVNLIDREGDNVPLFPANRLDKYDLNNSLRTAIATLMQDED